MNILAIKPIWHTPKAGSNAGLSKTYLTVESHPDGPEGRLLTLYTEWGDDYDEILLSPDEVAALREALS